MPASVCVSAAFIAVRSSGSASRNARINASSSFLLRSSAMDALTVAVVRGGMVESRHRIHAVRVHASGSLAEERGGAGATGGGSPAEERGDAGLVTFRRSPAKPIQALLLVRSYDDLAEEDTAIA